LYIFQKQHDEPISVYRLSNFFPYYDFINIPEQNKILKEKYPKNINEWSLKQIIKFNQYILNIDGFKYNPSIEIGRAHV
jgi:hypothetical protein